MMPGGGFFGDAPLGDAPYGVAGAPGGSTGNGKEKEAPRRLRALPEGPGGAAMGWVGAGVGIGAGIGVGVGAGDGPGPAALGSGRRSAPEGDGGALWGPSGEGLRELWGGFGVWGVMGGVRGWGGLGRGIGVWERGCVKGVGRGLRLGAGLGNTVRGLGLGAGLGVWV